MGPTSHTSRITDRGHRVVRAVDTSGSSRSVNVIATQSLDDRKVSVFLLKLIGVARQVRADQRKTKRCCITVMSRPATIS